MKKILIAYAALVIVVLILAFTKFNGGGFFPNLGDDNKTVKIKNREYVVEVAKDDKTRQIGLSNKKSLDQNKGMLFTFPKKGKYTFWMKNTFIPLDIIFIDDNKIVYIVKNAQPDSKAEGELPLFTTPKDANYVLEINGGLSDKYQFEVGDLVDLKGIK